ncbi:MAG TPA: hypothetical protein VK335_11795 [Bryobacteraceae bacterium]|nr:hypothetical protein [Bryobacteraceae bacterium]
MVTTTFRLWLQTTRIQPDWTGIKLQRSPKYLAPDCIEVTVKGNGNNLRRWLAERRDIFAAYVQMKPKR